MISDVRSVPDDKLTASSSAAGISPADARLYTMGGWESKSGDNSPWIQVDFEVPVNVTGIMTQGIKVRQIYL
jgi:hypothetical protein